MKRIVVIEGTTKKVTQIKNLTQLTKLYPQLSVTQDAVINTRALAASQAPLTLLADKDGGAPNYISVGAYKDALVSHDSSNTAYATAVVCTASIPTDTPNTGILKIYDTGAGTIATSYASGSLTTTNPMTIRITAIGNVITVYINGLQLFTYTDVTNKYPSGRIGFGGYDNGSLQTRYYDNIIVDDGTIAATYAGGFYLI